MRQGLGGTYWQLASVNYELALDSGFKEVGAYRETKVHYSSYAKHKAGQVPQWSERKLRL